MNLESVLIVTVIFASFYGIVELFVRKKERLNIIEKLGDKLDPTIIENKFVFPSYNSRGGFTTLKIACLLIGLGLGFLIGTQLDINVISDVHIKGLINELRGITYTALVLIFGGLGLLISFLIERNSIKKNKK
ncbi:MAG: hypothetical protein LBL90_08235 [Prevotellaceae bacterium]|jgi:hypothetical protein|nr:hypothetical protein [Prevotellaceae bacterium]